MERIRPSAPKKYGEAAIETEAQRQRRVIEARRLNSLRSLRLK
jgi:hypothetical protein